MILREAFENPERKWIVKDLKELVKLLAPFADDLEIDWYSGGSQSGKVEFNQDAGRVHIDIVMG